MTADDVLHADLCELLNALGLGAHARPYSAHQVMQDEILPRVRSLTARRCESGCGCRYGTNDPDRFDCGCDGPCTLADDDTWGTPR